MAVQELKGLGKLIDCITSDAGVAELVGRGPQFNKRDPGQNQLILPNFPEFLSETELLLQEIRTDIGVEEVQSGGSRNQVRVW